VQTNGTVTDKKTEEPKWKRKLHISLGYLIVAAKAKFKFHTAVGCVVVAAKIAVLAGVIQKSEFISSRVKLPEKFVAAAAMSLVLGKSLYTAIKETKELSELLLYFIALFKDTSICSMILITELTGLYYQNKFNRDLAVELVLTIGLIYLVISYPLSLLAAWLERRMSRGGAT
jgi:predicted benzoate:H+ symporter BenE